MIWFKFHLGDFSQDTLGLTQAEEGSYSLLLRAAYSSEAGIPKDEIYEITKARTADERRATDKIIRKFWKLQEDGYHQKRVDEEIAAYREKSEKAAASAQARWSERNANAMRTDMPTHMPTHPKRMPNAMLAKNQEPENYKQPPSKHRGNATEPDPASRRDVTPVTPLPIAALRSVCVRNRVACDSTRDNMHLGQWANEGTSPETVQQAIDIARANGKPDPDVIPIRYLLPIVSDLRSGKRQPIEPRGTDAIPIAIANLAAQRNIVDEQAEYLGMERMPLESDEDLQLRIEARRNLANA